MQKIKGLTTNGMPPLSRPVPDPKPNEPGLLLPARWAITCLLDLAQALAVDAARIELLRVEARTWPDASLGTPAPGLTYAQVATRGLVIQFRHQGQVYTYHTALQGPPQRVDAPDAALFTEDHPVLATAMLDLARRLNVPFSAIRLCRAERAASDGPQTSDSLTATLGHGRRTYRYQGSAVGPLTLQDPVAPA